MSAKIKNIGPVKIIQDANMPVEREVLAQAIVNISASFVKLAQSGLNRRGIIALLADDTKYGKGVIDDILKSLDSLAKNYTR